MTPSASAKTRSRFFSVSPDVLVDDRGQVDDVEVEAERRRRSPRRPWSCRCPAVAGEQRDDPASPRRRGPCPTRRAPGRGGATRTTTSRRRSRWSWRQHEVVPAGPAGSTRRATPLEAGVVLRPGRAVRRSSASTGAALDRSHVGRAGRGPSAIWSGREAERARRGGHVVDAVAHPPSRAALHAARVCGQPGGADSGATARGRSTPDPTGRRPTTTTVHGQGEEAGHGAPHAAPVEASTGHDGHQARPARASRTAPRPRRRRRRRWLRGRRAGAPPAAATERRARQRPAVGAGHLPQVDQAARRRAARGQPAPAASAGSGVRPARPAAAPGRAVVRRAGASTTRSGTRALRVRNGRSPVADLDQAAAHQRRRGAEQRRGPCGVGPVDGRPAPGPGRRWPAAG